MNFTASLNSKNLRLHIVYLFITGIALMYFVLDGFI